MDLVAIMDGFEVAMIYISFSICITAVIFTGQFTFCLALRGRQVFKPKAILILIFCVTLALLIIGTNIHAIIGATQ